MPETVIGGVINVYVPNVDELIALGYTHIRVYWATSENGSYSHVNGTSTALVAGTTSYEYNYTTGAPTDWAKYTFYGATPGETVSSEPIRVGAVNATRKEIRRLAGRLLRMMEPVVALSAVTDGDTIVADSMADADGLAQRFQNYWIRSGTQSRQVRRATSSPAGWIPASGTFNLRRAFSPSLSTSDEIEVWRPKGQDDPSVLMDEAMQSARRHVWWQEVFYLTTTADVSEYDLPAGIIESPGQVARVEYAAGTFPSQPDWRPVAGARVLMDGGVPLISLKADGWGNMLQANIIVRVILNRFGDRMDSDTDYWNAPLEYCAAAVAREFLKRMGVPSGSTEVTDDVRVAMAVIEDELRAWQALAPAPEIRMEPPA